MGQLIYHSPETPEGESPFDREIIKVAKGNDIKIVSPYLGLSYLNRLVSVASSWRLLSDVHEWLTSQPSSERQKIIGFLQMNEAFVHHYPAIHAKAVISSHSAYIGSANLTMAGVLRRTELGMVVTEKPLVAELNQWFDALWVQSAPASIDGIRELVTLLDKQEEGSPLRAQGLSGVISLASKAKSVRAKLSRNTSERHPVPSELERIEGTRKDLEDVVALYVDNYAAKGFTLQALHARVKVEGPLGSSVKDTYLELLTYCATQPRSFFWTEALNRLVFQDGVFVQSERTRLNQTLAQFDTFIESLIKALSFSIPKPLDIERARDSTPGISPAGQKLIVEGMKDIGMLSGSGPFLLNEELEWTQRLKLLSKAFTTWSALLTKHQFSKAESPTTSKEDSPPDSVVGAPNETNAGSDGSSLAMPPALAPTPISVQPIAAETEESRATTAKVVLVEKQFAGKEYQLQQLDQCFRYLAERYWQQKSTTKLRFKELTRTLAKLTLLVPHTLKAAIKGELPGISSPFFVKNHERGHPYLKIHANLHNNETLLSSLPKTLAFIKSKPLLEAQLHKNPEALQALTLGVPFKGLAPEPQGSMAEIDKRYLLLAKKVAELPSAIVEFKNAERLIAALSDRSKAKARSIRHTLEDMVPPSLQLFRLRAPAQQPARLEFVEFNLEKYPATKVFLQRYWRLPGVHPWLYSPRFVPDLVKAEAMAAPKPLSMEERDKLLKQVVEHIRGSIPRAATYRLLPDIAKEIGRALTVGPDRIMELIQYAPSPLAKPFEVKYQRGGFVLRLRRDALRFYPATSVYVKTVIDQQRAHPWTQATEDEKALAKVSRGYSLLPVRDI